MNDSDHKKHISKLPLKKISIQKITEELNQAFIFVVMTKNKGQTMPDFALNILQYFLFIFLLQIYNNTNLNSGSTTTQFGGLEFQPRKRRVVFQSRVIYTRYPFPLLVDIYKLVV